MRMRMKICLMAAGAFIIAVCIFTPIIIMYLQAHADEIKESAQKYMSTGAASFGGGLTFDDMGLVAAVLAGCAGFIYYVIKS